MRILLYYDLLVTDTRRSLVSALLILAARRASVERGAPKKSEDTF